MGISTNICVVVELFGRNIAMQCGYDNFEQIMPTLDCVQPWTDCVDSESIYGYIIRESPRYFNIDEIKYFEFESDIEKAKKDFFDIVGVPAEVYFSVIQS